MMLLSVVGLASPVLLESSKILQNMAQLARQTLFVAQAKNHVRNWLALRAKRKGLAPCILQPALVPQQALLALPIRTHVARPILLSV
jgi:hypothetical protein